MKVVSILRRVKPADPAVGTVRKGTAFVAIRGECPICGQPGRTCEDVDLCQYVPEDIVINGKSRA